MADLTGAPLLEKEGDMRSKKPILLVEDDKVDVMSVQRAFKAIHVTNRIEVVSNGEEALSHLRNSENENVLEKRTFKSKNWLVVRTNVCRKYI